ncbi:MAG TPA: tRNA lysidine(34) synthetase TilS [Acidobacteriaceae bacterium]|nr:tRNA lysidine(34) synthetase TilS [Acidobacteriaceae bacterium]
MARRPSSKPSGKGRAEDALPLQAKLFSPGDRVCVAVSGGADSTALLRLLLEQSEDLGIVLSVVHVEHGLRGEAGDADAAFVRELAQRFDLPCEIASVDTPRRVAEHKESVEEAARNLRYGVFRDLLLSGAADKIATAHSLDDQAETVLMKLLRGAWTEGLSGIHPSVQIEGGNPRGSIVRPLLASRRWQIEAYLRSLGQPWRQDETNESSLYLRNRIRHELLPAMRPYNGQIEEILAHVAANARCEEQHWKAELTRVLPQLVLEGQPVRGGGRRTGTAPGLVQLAVEISRLRALSVPLQRRVLRAAAERCGATLDFSATERLLEMAAHDGSFGRRARGHQRLSLPGGVQVERSARELQFERQETAPTDKMGGNSQQNQREGTGSNSLPAYDLPVPGKSEAPAFGASYTASLLGSQGSSGSAGDSCTGAPGAEPAHIRAWRPGDRVWVRHSRKPKKVKEILERMGIRGAEKSTWPVIEWQGRIRWMRGVELAEGAYAGSESGHSARLQITEERSADLSYRLLDNQKL